MVVIICSKMPTMTPATPLIIKLSDIICLKGYKHFTEHNV